MSPVLGYVRTDRVDRTKTPHRRYSGSDDDNSRSRSPQSQTSQDSGSSGNSGNHQITRFAAGSAGAALLNRFASWNRGSNSASSNSSSGNDSNSEEFNAHPEISPDRNLHNQQQHQYQQHHHQQQQQQQQQQHGRSPGSTNNNPNVPTNGQSNGRLASPPFPSGESQPPSSPYPTSAGSSNDGVKHVNIEDYCLGTPKKIGQSHAGAVESFMSVQEKAIFSPTVKRHRHHRHHHHNQHHRRHRHHNASTDTDNAARSELEDPAENDTDRHSGEASADNRRGGPSVFDEYEPPESHHENENDETRPFNEQDNDDENDANSEDDTDHDNANASDNGPEDADLEAPPSDENDAELDASGNAAVSGPQRTLDSHSGGTNDDANAHNSPCSTSRGSVSSKSSKPTKIKEIGVDFYCMSRTSWNSSSQSSVSADSTSPNNAQVEDTAYLGIHHWDFVPLEQFGSAQSQYDKTMASQSATLIGQDSYGADVAVFKDDPNVLQQRKFSRVYNSEACRVRGRSSHLVPVFGPSKNRPRKSKPSTVHSDGVVFPAGSYVYNFTSLVDAKTPGSVHVPNGQVKFVMAARVVRAGAFSMNVNGHMEVDVVRAPPDATSDGAVFGPMNDAVSLSRVWNDRFVYSVNIDRRNMTSDVPTRMTSSLSPLSDPDVRLHQVQVYAMETVTYVYSLDPTIRYVDPDSKLSLFQKDAPGPKHSGNLLHPTDATTISTDLTSVSMYNRAPHAAARQPYQRGRFGETRFIEPDVKGPYISVKHRLMLVMRVSRSSDVDDSRCHYEVKIDTPICVQSRHCVAANIRSPSYSAPNVIEISPTDAISENTNGITATNGEGVPRESPPSFNDAMNHELLGPSGADSANRRGIKADFRSVQ